MVLSSVLVLLLVGCNSDSDNGSDGNGNGNVNGGADVNFTGDITAMGTPLSSLPENEIEPNEFLDDNLDEILIDGIEISFDENYGAILLTPVNINQDPWETILSELSDENVSGWSDFVNDALSHFMNPIFSQYIVAIVSPFNGELLWLMLVDGSEIIFSAFELDYINEDSNSGPGNHLDFVDMLHINGRDIDISEWREWFVADSAAEVEIPISLIFDSEIVSIDQLADAFGPMMNLDYEQAILELGEFNIIIDFTNASDVNITHVIVTKN